MSFYKLIIFLCAFVLSISCSFAASKTNTNSSIKTSASQVISSKINIHTANKEALSNIKGIGPKKAQEIISYRQKNGNFKSINDLTNVKGLGEKNVKKISSYLTI